MTKITDLDIMTAVERHGTQRAAASSLGMAKSTYQDRLIKALASAFTQRSQPAPRHLDPGPGVRYAIFSSAQDGSEVHPFLVNLEAYARSLNAPIHISGYTYNKKLFEDHNKHRASFSPHVRPYLTNHRMNVADDLVFCGEMNTLPTATTPLTGFETYTRHKWGIFPHAKVQLHSIPTMSNEPAKILMTTGTVTMPNYVQKKAGIKAEFHHIIGAVLVEIMPSGAFFCRHLLAEDDGSFYDLGRRVSYGQITEGHRLRSLVPGDIHFEKLDPECSRALFGTSARPHGFYDAMRPEYMALHDLIDFTPRNHHSIADPYQRYQSFNNGADNVETTFAGCADFLADLQRPWCEIKIVESNHDLAYHRWLKTTDYRTDPANALFFLESQLRQYRALHANEDRFSIFEWAMRRTGGDFGSTEFLREDPGDIPIGGIFPIDGIEHGMHGHNGANGARPSAMQFTRMGPRVTAGHTHSPCILDGYYCTGVTGKLRMGYNNTGMSSWSQSLVAQYDNGKRVICTMQDNMFSAEK